jgi:cytoskeletal protein RodZ
MFFRAINNFFDKSLILKGAVAAALLLFWLAATVSVQGQEVAAETDQKPQQQQQQERQTASAQTKTEEMKAATTTTTATATPPPLLPILQDYKGIKIGMTEDEVRDKLGKPKVSDQTGYFYVFSDEEQAQVGFDAEQKVNMIAVFYAAEHENKPQYRDVFGADAAAAHQKDDGSIYNVVNYPQAGYWVAYSRLAGDKAMVTVTMQKMRTKQ